MQASPCGWRRYYHSNRLLVLLFAATGARAFIVDRKRPCDLKPILAPRSTAIYANLPEIETMKIGELKGELESYGISTKSFLEKKEMKEALEKARKDGIPPKKDEKEKGKDSASSSKRDKAKPKKKSREEKIAEATEKASKMKVGELKSQLQKMGISTKSFFEKSEFIKAYAEAVAEGAGVTEEEEFDSSYRDVTMQKMNARDPAQFRGLTIDIKLKK